MATTPADAWPATALAASIRRSAVRSPWCSSRWRCSRIAASRMSSSASSPCVCRASRRPPTSTGSISGATASMRSGSATTGASRSDRCESSAWSGRAWCTRRPNAGGSALPNAPPLKLEAVEVGLQEERERVLGGLDDRLAGTVEGGVEDDGHAGQRFEAAEQVVEGAAALVDGLDARGAVDVGDGRQALRLDLGGEEHVGRGQRSALEPVGGAGGKHGGRERAPGFAPLDAVDAAPVLGLAGIGEDRAVAEGARADLAPALEPADDLVVDEVAGGGVGPVGRWLPSDAVAVALEGRFDRGIVDARAQIGVDRHARRQRPVEDVVVEGEGGAERQAAIVAPGRHMHGGE